MVPNVSLSCFLCENNFNFFSFNNNYTYSFNPLAKDIKNHNRRRNLGKICCSSGRARVSSHWRVQATTNVRVVENSRSSAGNVSSQAAPVTATVEIPVTCYQILGVPDKAEKDEIVKSVMHLKKAEIEEGYTMDTVISRQKLLLDVRDKLLFEPEYAGNIKEKVPPKTPLQIPWTWLPSALCILQEVGEENLVLEIGRKSLQHKESEPYIHDLLLSMALAECAIAKAGFEKNKISQGFEALCHAQDLLKSKDTLVNTTLLSQINESLEELAPPCTLEILGMPRTPENNERRLRAIAALRELLRQGLDVEKTCQVQDWAHFLDQALTKLMAYEIVELNSWDSLALIRKNKKSIESQNQKVVIDFNSFYLVLIAHIALGFSSKQTNLINKAKAICECLIVSEGVDLKFEEAFCLYLLGQGDEATVIERLRKLESNTNPATHNLTPGKEIMDQPNANKSLETWLKDSVLGLFSDTRDCSPSLVNFFSSEKRASWNQQNKKSSNTMSNMRHRTLAPDRVLGEEFRNTSHHLGLAVKQLAPHISQGPFIASNENTGVNTSTPNVQLKRSFGARKESSSGIIGKIIFVTSLGCILFGCFKVINMGNTSKSKYVKSSTVSSISQSLSPIKGNRVEKLVSMITKQSKRVPQSTDLLGSSVSTYKRALKSMPVEEAEMLVKKWQVTKAEALGPTHYVDGLFDILDESMLEQWFDLAYQAKDKSCFWRFVLLQLSILEAEILSDVNGEEIAEIVVLLEEAAELVDESLPKNPNYYSTYKIRYVLKKQYDDSWRFCKADIQSP